MFHWKLRPVAMSPSADIRLIYTTVDSIKTAETLAHGLLDQQLIACANMLPAMQSIYRWEGNIMQEQETVILLKTAQTKCQDVISYLRKHHPYECPSILELPVIGGNPDFFTWIMQEVAKSG